MSLSSRASMMAITRKLVIAALFATVLFGLAGCAKLFGPRATVVDVDLRASTGLNPDATGRASPLRLRFYELKSISVFNSADFFSLYDRDKEVLGADIVVREEIQVEPGAQRSFTRKPAPDTKFIAVLAPYRDLDHAKWRAAMEVPANKTTQVELKLDPLAVSLAPPPKKK
jgi:type VI secretion system protein VasD